MRVVRSRSNCSRSFCRSKYACGSGAHRGSRLLSLLPLMSFSKKAPHYSGECIPEHMMQSSRVRGHFGKLQIGDEQSWTVAPKTEFRQVPEEWRRSLRSPVSAVLRARLAKRNSYSLLLRPACHSDRTHHIRHNPDSSLVTTWASARNRACQTGRKKLMLSDVVVNDSLGSRVEAKAMPIAASARSHNTPPCIVPMGLACCGPACK